jgi:hypothetical protein
VVNLAGLDEVVALQPAEIDAVELVGLQRKPGNRQCLALRAGFLDPVIARLSRTFETTPSTVASSLTQPLSCAGDVLLAEGHLGGPGLHRGH